MPKLAARLALSVAMVTVVLTGLEALRLRHPRGLARPPSAVAAVTEAGPAVPRLAPMPITMDQVTPAEKPRPLGVPAMARIHGRVVASNLEELRLRIEDALRDYEPRIDDVGNFEMNLPPGDYVILATSDEETALAEVAGLLENEDREIVIVLGQGVAIEGRVDGCAGPCEAASIRATLPGHALLVATTESGKQGEFTLADLPPGRRYDLTFESERGRRLFLTAVAAPTRGLQATLLPARALSGGFGLGPGEKCPMGTVSVRGPGEHGDAGAAEFDRACRFRVERLPDGNRAEVRATGQGWHFDLEVALPPDGDPPFLCLRDPCREPEPVPRTTLEILFSGSPGHQAYVRVEPSDGQSGSGRNCDGVQPCVLADLYPAPGTMVNVLDPGCEQRTFKIDLLPGRNYLTYPCEALRAIQGVFKVPAEKLGPGGASVRCSHDRPVRPVRGFVFSLQCPTSLTAVEYQLVPGGPWQAAPIPPTSEDGPAFVEITAE